MNAFTERRQMRGQSGFTLIELLVVIAILGILAGVVVFAVTGIGDTGQASACEIEARTIKTAVQASWADNSVFPTVEADLVPDFLEDSPTGVALTYDATGAVTPTYAWAGDCVGVPGLPATP